MVGVTEPECVARLAEAIANGEPEPVDRLFSEQGLPSPEISWNPRAAAVDSKVLGFLIEFWQGRVNGEACPLEDAIDPIDLGPALGNLLVCEPTDGFDDFRIRLYGSRLALEMGRDLTGNYVSEIQPGSYITTFYLACYRAVAAARRPLFTRHEPSEQSFAFEIKRVLLPFGQADRVTRILAGVDSRVRRPLGRPLWAKRR